MQQEDGYIFYLDAPREQPREKPGELFGWIAADRPIDFVRLHPRSSRPLTQEPRPDVAAAFPGRAHVIGFRGEAGAGDLSEGSLHFEFSLAGSVRRTQVALPPRPRGARGVRRWRAQAARAWARWRLRGWPSVQRQWNSGLSLLLAEVKLERGDAFGRAESDSILGHFARVFPRATVVQIGANDGSTGDPLIRWFSQAQWRGVLVEPVPHLAAALACLHAGRPEIAIECAAITEKDGSAQIYRLREGTEAPIWFQQLATFDRSVLEKHRGAIPDFDSRLVEETVAAISVATLLQKHRLETIDLLVIDTEGHDYRILRQFDLARLRPLLVMFEHQHLSPVEKEEAGRLLRRHGYSQAETPEGDTLAWRSVDRAGARRA